MAKQAIEGGRVVSTEDGPAPKGYVEVVATSRGFYGVGKLGSRIEEGETFYVREGARLGSWFQVVDEKDGNKLLPSKKADKLKAKREADRLFRMAKDPVALIQTVREMALAGAPIGIPEGKALNAAPSKPARSEVNQPQGGALKA